MDIEFGAYVIALRVRRVDNTKMVAEFLSVKVARISLNNLGFIRLTFVIKFSRKTNAERFRRFDDILSSLSRK